MKSTISNDCSESILHFETPTFRSNSQVRMFIVFASIFLILFLALYYSFNSSHKRADTYYGPLDKSIKVKNKYHLAPIPVVKEVVFLADQKYPRFDFSLADSFSDKVSPRFLSGVNSIYLIDSLLKAMPYDVRRLAKRYIEDILRFSQINNLDPIWVLAVIWTESHFQSRVRSHANATGLMQIMPDTGKFINVLLKRPTDQRLISQLLMDPRTNIELGTFYLQRLYKSFNSHIHATIAYNMGPGFVVGRLKTGGPLGVKNHYLNKVMRHYGILASAIEKIQAKSAVNANYSVLLYKAETYQISYYLGEDLNMIPLPKYALRHENFYPKRLVRETHFL